MRIAIWLMVLVLLIIHQDFWFWNSELMVFGFIPIGLFYHACISIAASITWFMACQFAWPDDTHDVVPSEVASGEEAKS